MYEIYSYGNNDSLYGIFNAVAAITGANSYVQALAVVAFCGFATAALAYAFAPQKLIGWQWLASVLLVYTLLFVPKVTVGVVDKLGTQPVQIIANVPFGLAFFGSLTSAIGNTLTEVFETAFQTLPGPAQQPADLAYQRHGVMFGNTLIKRTRQIVFNDPNFRTDLINFVHNCTMYDLADGTIDPVVFSKAPVGNADLWSLMATPNPARFSTVTAGGTSDSRPCPTVYANLNARMPAIINITVEKLAALLNPNLPIAQAVTEVSSQAVQAYLRTNLGNAAVDATAIVRQNGLINAINDTSEIIGQKINDPAALILGLGRAQASAQTNAAWINFGKMAEDALPLIRNAIEAIIYALFPFVVLLLFFTYGTRTMTSLQSYVVTLVWIQLWPPIYAILNYMASIASAKHIAAAAQLGGNTQGLTLVSASSIYSTTISDQAVVGYLVLAIPSIAWAAVKGMQTVAQAALLGTSSLQGNVSSAAAAAGTGNLGMGNVTMDQVNLSPNTSSAYMRTATDIWGTASQDITPHGSPGVARMKQNISSLATTLQFSERQASAMSEASRESEVASQTQREASTQSTAAALTTAMSMEEQYARSSALAGASATGMSGRSSREVNSMLQIADTVQKLLGADAHVDAGKRVVASAALSGRAGIATPPGSIFGASAGVGGSAEFQGSTGEQERLSQALAYAKSALERSGIATGTTLAENFSKTDTYEWARRSNAVGAERFDSSLREAEEHHRNAEKLHSNSVEQARMAQFMSEYATGTSTDASNFLWQRLVNTGRDGEFLRADPLTQQRMALDIAKDYAGGGPGLGGWHVPNDAFGPSNQKRLPGRSPQEVFGAIDLGGAGKVGAAHETFDGRVAGKQRAAGVGPGQLPVDTVSPRAAFAEKAVKERQETEASRISGESGSRHQQHDAAMSEKADKNWVQGAEFVSKDAAAVTRDVTGQKPK